MGIKYGREDRKIKINSENLISKVSGYEKYSIIEKLSFFDFDNLDCRTGEKIVVRVREDIENIRYIDLNYTTFEKTSVYQYKKNEQLLQKLIIKIAAFLKDNFLFLIKYDEKWIKDKRLSRKLYDLFMKNGISDSENILFIRDKSLVSNISKANFRNNMLSYFVFIEDEIIIVPTDHMDIFIFGKSEKIRELKGYLNENLYIFKYLQII